MLELHKIADLDISAASGLVVLGRQLYAVADDELFLASYDFAGAPLSRVPLFAGELPEAHAERKAQKPDLEALAALPDGRLFAFGSGSTPRRMRGAVIDPLQARGAREVDLAPLYTELGRELADLNIEGATVHEERLWLGQRGNGAAGINACIELDLRTVLAEIEHGIVSSAALRAVHAVSLGTLDGVPLGFTDLCAHPRTGLLFTAAAEGGSSTYEDGACAGSVIGSLSTQAEVRRVQRVEQVCKLEGVAVAPGDGEQLVLFLVADPDDRKQRAPLYRAEISESLTSTDR
jgi:hypothetical protein